MNDEAMDNADSIVKIDSLNLDKECIRLPSHYLQYARLAADSRADVTALKAQLDVVQADVGNKVRCNPEKYGLEKVTEKGIEAVVLSHEDYRSALRSYQKAEHRQSLYQAVVWALEHKKRSLTLLVELHGLGYFSDPKLSAKGRQAVEEMTKRRVRPHVRDED